MEPGEHEEARRKRPRKSRGRGLRTNTGCLTCRKRHKKCDEQQPVCGPCSVSSRHCVFPHDLDAQNTLESLHRAPVSAAAFDHSSVESGTGQSPSLDSVLILREDAASLDRESQPSNRIAPILSHDVNARAHDSLEPNFSPDSIPYEKWTADFASTRWLDLLANDAAQADSGFSLAPTPVPESHDAEQGRLSSISTHVSPALLNGQAQLPEDLDPESERKAWQSDRDVTLTNHEAVLFRHFADRCARWLEICHPQRLFSTYVIHLALRNVGLMKAILALSAKHRLKCLGITTDEVIVESNNNFGDNGDDHWIRYYYESLHYIREALAYSSYTHSEELLATAIVISLYEMLDESDGSGNWQRHLKGVFWIQRSQDVDGGCGGLRQAVWWAWLRQDLWAAFREKRMCFSFWRPRDDIHTLDQNGLADRAVYLLSQAVNYRAAWRKAEAACAGDPSTSLQWKKCGDALLDKLERWKSCLGDAYSFLPASNKYHCHFLPLWVHPPNYAVALQAYNFAKILVTLHNPNKTGFAGFLKMQKVLSEAVDTICGIALELKDESCQIISAQCVYGAGLCVQDPGKREGIISIIKGCQAQVGWEPMTTWIEDLRLEWAAVDREMSEN